MTTPTEDIHSCSYFCTRPGCVLAQRDEMREELARLREQEPCAWVDVKDGDQGPYEFHGMKKLPPGRHHLYAAAPPAQPAAQPVQRLSDEQRRELIDVLRGGRQCDEDGTEIIMSRQACCEAADIIEAALQPQGWALVPIEPYPSQRIAGTAEWMRQSAQDDDPDTDKTAAVYRAMTAANAIAN